MALFMENTTTTPSTFQLHVASVDPAPFYDLVIESTSDIVASGSLPQFIDIDDANAEWDIIFPVRRFLPNSRRTRLTSPPRNRSLSSSRATR